MPLHDWRDDRGWESVHLVWLPQLLDWVQPRLPNDYRAYVRSVVAPAETKPDEETVVTFTLDPHWTIHVDLDGHLIAAMEVVSPRNKDRPSARERYLGRYVGYLRQGVHLLLIDALPRPAGFSFADALAANLGFAQPACPAPCAVSYRVGEPVPDGTILALWRRPLHIGQPLPVVPLALDSQQRIPIDLEHTYCEAARRAYLE
jgi:hypothetical protein